MADLYPAPTPEEFLVWHAEFSPATPELVAATISAAALECSSAVYRNRRAEAIGWLAAHMLWSSAFGITMRGNDDTDQSKYLRRYQRIRTQCTPHAVVT